jgi:predicted GIY-YIG superfamily endonuclease
MNNEEIKYIYVLKDPRDNSVRYVGMTKDPKKRLKGHCDDRKRKNNKKSTWNR